MKAFISYNTSDQYLANNISEILTKNGIKHFFAEKNISLGEDIIKVINKEFDGIDILIIILSPGSLKSNWVMYEAGIATGKGITILPFLTHPDIDPPAFLKSIKYATSVDEIHAYFSETMYNSIDIVLKLNTFHLEGTYCNSKLKTPPKLLLQPIFDFEKEYHNNSAVPGISLDVINTGLSELHLNYPKIIFNNGHQASFQSNNGFNFEFKLPVTHKETFKVFGIEKIFNTVLVSGIESIFIKDFDNNKAYASQEEVDYANKYINHFFNASTLSNNCKIFHDYMGNLND